MSSLWLKASPFFGGIPATGAFARTATNVRSGAQTPVGDITDRWPQKKRR